MGTNDLLRGEVQKGRGRSKRRFPAMVPRGSLSWPGLIEAGTKARSFHPEKISARLMRRQTSRSEVMLE
jgi:hypothetical protein